MWPLVNAEYLVPRSEVTNAKTEVPGFSSAEELACLGLHFRQGSSQLRCAMGMGMESGFPFCTAPTGPSCPTDAVCEASIGIWVSSFTLGTSCADIVTGVEVILPSLPSVQPFWKMGRIYMTVRDERSAEVWGFFFFFCIFLALALNLTNIYQRWLYVRHSS